MLQVLINPKDTIENKIESEVSAEQTAYAWGGFSPRSGSVVRPRWRHISTVKVRVRVYHSSVAESNCVVVRRGGEQLEANCRSAG